MKLYELTFDDYTRKEIAKVIAYAKKHVFDFSDEEKVLTYLFNEDLYPGNNPEFVVHIHNGFRVVYSIEKHEKSLTAHFSVSHESKKLPPPQAVALILRAFGMRDLMESDYVTIQYDTIVHILQNIDEAILIHDPN